MHQFTLTFPIMPKPRGKLGKSGNIYHNDAKYKAFKKAVGDVLIRSIPMGYRYKLPIGYHVVQEYIPKKRGAEPDLDNLGSVLDCLVQQGYIPEDNRSVVAKQSLEAIESDQNSTHFILYSIDYERGEAIDLFEIEVAKVYNRLKAKGHKFKYGDR